MEPAIVAFSGDLDLNRYPEVHGALEAAKVTKSRPVVVDLSEVRHVDSMIAAEIVLFVRRSLRYGATVAIVPPPPPNEWLTHAASIREAHFRESAAEALELVGG
ncbi:MAG TPA: STAS domain-containing protein [Candidatus Elarobacter sp.]|jgi:anti-anti-sigma regulatory factor|nr:STAS domain-containing protein [Candidatus Elarobacter sp.]